MKNLQLMSYLMVKKLNNFPLKSGTSMSVLTDSIQNGTEHPN